MSIGRWYWTWNELKTRIWFRAALISLMAVMLALAGALLAPIIPYDWSIKIGGDAVDAILSILASSMLAVTTFSLTAMVAAFSGASQQVTPRAVHLLIQDRIAQNALSTFLGGFVFSLVSIVALTTGIYGAQGRVILFAGTIAVAIIIVLTLLRWIARLVNFGRVDDAIEMLEKKSERAVSQYPGPILFKGTPRRLGVGETNFDGRTGYLAHIDRAALSELAAKAGIDIRLGVAAGDLVDPTIPIVFSSRPLSNAERATVAKAMTITRNRNFDQDPRFGMQVFAEIAMRALSPAINDPGTAIQVLVAAQRVLDGFVECEDAGRDPLPGLTDLPLSFEEMVGTLVRPIARDSAGMIEVGMRIQSMLGSLAEQIPQARPFLVALASDALERNRAANLSESDRTRIEHAHRDAFAGRVER